MSSNARKKTLARMKTLVAFSASALAIGSTADGCSGFETVDPLPFPSGGFCNTFRASFSVTARTFSVDGFDAGCLPEDAQTGGGDAADADADAATKKDSGGPCGKSGGKARILLAIEVRFPTPPPGGTPLSLKSGVISVLETTGPQIVERRPSTQLLEIEIDPAYDPALPRDGTHHITMQISDVGDCGGTPADPILQISIQDGVVVNILGSLAGQGDEDVSFSP